MRVVLVTNGIASTLHAGLELAQRLGERGHEVVLLSHADVAATCAANGVPFVHLRADREAFGEVRAGLDVLRRGPLGARVRAAVRLPGTAWRARARTVRADELIDRLREIDPDVMAIDIEAHVAVIASAQLGVPTALTTFLFAIEQRPGVPPIDSWMGPDDQRALDAAWDAVRRRNAAVRWRRRRSRLALVDRLAPVSYATTSRDALRAVARRTGFDLRAATDTRQWLRPHGYVHLPVLSTNLRELEFGAGASPGWHYVGPMVHATRHDVQAGDERPWEAAIARRRDDSGRRLVYCSLGSYWAADTGLLRRVVEVFVRHPEWDLVIGLGSRGDPAALGELPPNVTALRWAPQVEILRSADAAVVHGGSASLDECVVAGVPMLVCSTGHLDQNGIAARVAHHGIGRACAGATVDADRLESLLTDVLFDADVRTRAEELAGVAADPARRSVAVDLLERFAASGRA